MTGRKGIERCLKVLVLTNMYPDPAHPFQGIFVKQQVESLRAIGVEVDVLFVNGPASRFNYLKGIFRLWQMLLRHKYDLIHAHHIYSGVIARMQPCYPVVITFHGSEILRVRFERRLSELTIPLVQGIIAVSAEMKESLGKRQAFVIPCGVDMDLFQPMGQLEARMKLNLPLDKKLVLFVGKPRPEKRFDLVQRAFSLLQEQRTDIQLMQVSSEPPETIPLYMNAGDALVLASDKEGSPQVIKEAMACNLPVVSVPVGDVPEVIGGTEGCYLCSQEPEDIAQKLLLALAWGHRTRGHSQIAHLSLDRIADRVLDVYEKVLGNSS